MANGNEFEEMYNKDDFNDEDTTNSEEHQEQEDLIVGNSRGVLYDFSKAPKVTKGPERILMDGKEVTISKIELVIPPEDAPWKLSKNNNVKYKSCIFSVYYDDDGQKEYYSGIKVFERKVNGISKYSEPAIQNNASTQISQLKKTYATFKNKTSEEVSLHEFFAFLNSKPKALLKVKDFEYYDDKQNQKIATKKNIVEKFI